MKHIRITCLLRSINTTDKEFMYAFKRTATAYHYTMTSFVKVITSIAMEHNDDIRVLFEAFAKQYRDREKAKSATTEESNTDQKS